MSRSQAGNEGDRSGDGGSPRHRDRPPRRLRRALYAYPSEVRDAHGDVLISLARDLVDSGASSVGREALGLLRGGVAARLGLVALAPWDPALRRSAILATAAWVIAGAGALFLVHEGATPLQPLTLGALHMDGLALSMVAGGFAATVVGVVGFARRRRDPVGLLSGALILAGMLPVALVYLIGQLPLGDAQMRLALLGCVVAMVVATLRLVRLSATLATWVT